LRSPRAVSITVFTYKIYEHKNEQKDFKAGASARSTPQDKLHKTINPAQSPERSTSRFHYDGYVFVAAAFFAKELMWGSNYCFGIFIKPFMT
jgi:hypothetical protein